MAWDDDGTVGLWKRDNFAATDLNDSQRAALNDESGNNIAITTNGALGYVEQIFPELREFDGYFIVRTSGGDGGFSTLDSSADTTNGIDGTWTQRTADVADGTSTDPEYRTSITSHAIPGVKGLRVYKNATGGGQDHQMQTIHIYGVISAGETPDRILFLDTEDSDQEFTKVLNFGDKARGQTTTRTFKIKNNSSTKTINTIQITAEDLYLNAGDWYTFGDDGVAYQATHAVGNLGPGSTELVYLKQVIPGGETLGLQAGRIKVSHASVT